MKKKRKYGSGTVRKRSDGRWEGRLIVEYSADGKPKTKSVLAQTKTECLEKLKKAQEEIHVVNNNKIDVDMTFGSWLDFWYINYHKFTIKESTRAKMENEIYNHIIPSIGYIPLKELSQADLQSFYSEMKMYGRLQYEDVLGKGLSDSSVRAMHLICHLALEKAVELNMLVRNPTDGCKPPPKKAKEMQILSPEEMQRVLIQAKYDDLFELLLLALTTGMRRGELLGLQWTDLNFDTYELKIQRQVYSVRGELTISEPKTESSIRTIILPRSVVEVLRKYKETVDSIWMFPSPIKKGYPRDPHSVYKKTQKILERAECKKVRFHDLRHTFATTALANGMDIKTLSNMIGHVTSKTTLDVYLHSTQEMKKKAATKIEQKIGKNEAITDNLEQKERNDTTKEQNAKFEPKTGKYRKMGTGCISKINDNLYEGRYSPRLPNGKRISRNIYAHTREECEEKLAEMIIEVKAEISELREQLQREKEMGMEMSM